MAEAEYEDNDEGESAGMTWKFNGKYWQARESQNWPSEMLQLW